MIKRHRWSVLSLAVTFGAAAAIGSYTQYQYHVHHISDFSSLSPIGASAVLVSVATGVIAAVKERGSTISVIAIVLGLFSNVFYVV